MKKAIKILTLPVIAFLLMCAVNVLNSQRVHGSTGGGEIPCYSTFVTCAWGCKSTVDCSNCSRVYGCRSDLSPPFHKAIRLFIMICQRNDNMIPLKKYRLSTLSCFQKAEAFLNLKLMTLRMPDSMIPLPHINFFD